MIDNSLLSEIEAATKKVGGINSMPEDEASRLLEMLAANFVGNHIGRWWWNSLKKPNQRISYGDNDGLDLLARLVESEPFLVLIVTDDESPPWPAYTGSTRNIIDVLRDCRFFEYCLVPSDRRWAIFDTHHNELIIAGRLAK